MYCGECIWFRNIEECPDVGFCVTESPMCYLSTVFDWDDVEQLIIHVYQDATGCFSYCKSEVRHELEAQ